MVIGKRVLVMGEGSVGAANSVAVVTLTRQRVGPTKGRTSMATSVSPTWVSDPVMSPWWTLQTTSGRTRASARNGQLCSSMVTVRPPCEVDSAGV